MLIMDHEAEMIKSLECTICIETYTRPRNLPCGHTYCEECLKKLKFQEKQIKCPICGEKFVIPKKGVSGFGMNFPLVSQIDTLCNQCRETKSCETCSHCQKQLCVLCSLGHMELQETSDLIKLLQNTAVKHKGTVDKWVQSSSLIIDNLLNEIDDAIQAILIQVDDRKNALKEAVSRLMEPGYSWMEQSRRMISDIGGFCEESGRQLSAHNIETNLIGMKVITEEKLSRVNTIMEKRPIQHLYLEHDVDAIAQSLPSCIRVGQLALNFDKITAEVESNGDVKTILKELPVPVRCQIINSFDCSPLSQAVLDNDIDLARYLLEDCKSKVDRCILYKDKPTAPLVHAAQFHYFDMMKLLVGHGADINITSDDGSTPILAAVRNNYVDIVKYLIELGGADINKANNDGHTCLQLSTFHADAEVCKLMLEFGANLDITGKDGLTPLHCATIQGHLEVIKCLLDSGACIEKSDNDGNTALMHAMEDSLLCQLLVKHGANANTSNNKNNSPLHLAIEKNDKVTAVMLVRNHADVNKRFPGSAEVTCLMECTSRTPEWCQIFLKEGAKVNETDSFGMTALHHAIKNGKLDIVDLLIQNGADSYRKDAFERDAFGMAKDQKQKGIEDYLNKYINPSTWYHLKTRINHAY